MAKRKKKTKRSQPTQTLSAPRGFGRKNFDTELRKAEAAMDKEDWGKAHQTLIRLGEDYPDRQIIWEYLTHVSVEMKSFTRIQFAAEQWLRLDPNNTDLLHNLGRTYLNRNHPLLALQTFSRMLELDPSHQYADEIRLIVDDLEEDTEILLAELDLPKEEAWAIAIMHERGQAYLEEGQLAQARESELAVLAKDPHFFSAQNNLSLIAYMEGKSRGSVQMESIRP